jgi:hypothetical protein
VCVVTRVCRIDESSPYNNRLEPFVELLLLLLLVLLLLLLLELRLLLMVLGNHGAILGPPARVLHHAQSVVSGITAGAGDHSPVHGGAPCR